MEAKYLITADFRSSSLSSTNSSLQDKMVSMETKYHGLLDLSEKLQDDLQQKTESFVVLDQMYKSLVPEKERAAQLSQDMERLVAEKVYPHSMLREFSRLIRPIFARFSSRRLSTRQPKHWERLSQFWRPPDLGWLSLRPLLLALRSPTLLLIL